MGAGGMGAGSYMQMAGGGIQSAASAHEAMDMAHAYETEALRQRRYRDQALGNFNSLVGQSGAGTAQGDMATGQANRLNLYNNLADANLSFTNNATTGVARDAAAEQLAGRAQSKIGRYGDWRFQQGLREQDSQRKLGQITNFASGMASVFPYRMYSAQHGWDWLRAAGQAISALGGASGSMNWGGGQPTSGGQPMPGTGGNLDEYAGGFNPNVGAQPYVYQQQPVVPYYTPNYYQNIGP